MTWDQLTPVGSGQGHPWVGASFNPIDACNKPTEATLLVTFTEVTAVRHGDDGTMA